MIWGGYTIEIDQFDFGHVAHKSDQDCIFAELHLTSFRNCLLKDLNIQTGVFAGNVPGTKRCTQYQREYSPESLIDWFEITLSKIQEK
jgi:hypothetical protein